MNKMKKEKFTGILNKQVLKFKNNKDLEKYYENKYKSGGYKGGYILHGINFSNIYHKERQKSALNFLSPAKNEVILDVGCGNGKVSLRVAKRAKIVYGVDIAKSALKNIKKKPKNLIFRRMNIENLRFRQDFFDKIVCVETLEHVLNPKKAIKELRRVLKRDGYLVLTYPTVNTTIIKKIEIKIGITKNFPVSEHLTEWDYDRLIDEMRKSGFKLISAKGVVFDLGKLGMIREISKWVAKTTVNIQLKIRKFPRNSSFITLKFQKV